MQCTIINSQNFNSLNAFNLLTLKPQPSGSNQIQVFWQVVEQKPGPIVAAIVMLGIGELISGFAITSAKVCTCK